MFSLSNVVDLFTHKFTRLCAWRFSLFFVSPRPFNDFFFRHFFTSTNYRYSLCLFGQE